MVIMRVRARNNVELANGAAPKVGGNNVLADVEFGLSVAAEYGNAATIDQHQLAIREGHQQAISLPDVKSGEFQLPLVDLRGERMVEDERKQRQHRHHRWPAPEARQTHSESQRQQGPNERKR